MEEVTRQLRRGELSHVIQDPDRPGTLILLEDQETILKAKTEPGGVVVVPPIMGLSREDQKTLGAKVAQVYLSHFGVEPARVILVQDRGRVGIAVQ